MRELTPEEEREQKERQEKESERNETDMRLFGFQFRKWDRRIQYFAMFGTIALLIAFVIVPMINPTDDLKLSRPLDLGRIVYFRTEAGDWYRLSVQDDDVFDSVNNLLRGTYDPTGELTAKRSEMAVLVVFREENNPLHIYWFKEGKLCDPTQDENRWKSYDRHNIGFSFDSLQKAITDQGKAVEPDTLGEWAKGLE